MLATKTHPARTIQEEECDYLYSRITKKANKQINKNKNKKTNKPVTYAKFATCKYISGTDLLT